MSRGERGDNQRRIMEYIRQYLNEKGYPPSVREIGSAVGLTSTSTVHGHLMRLEKKGLIHRDPMRPRAMEVLGEHTVREAGESNQVPVVGRVTAGLPILAIENIEEYVSLPPCMTGEGTYFILNVRGESMINVGIMDGDNVVVRKQPDAQNGDIVVAMIDDEATVKRFYKEKGHFRLQPENPDMAPIYTDHVEILGKVISLYRVF